MSPSCSAPRRSGLPGAGREPDLPGRARPLGCGGMAAGTDRLDVARVRGLFPALADGFVHADGPAGALLPESVARAVGQALRLPVADRGAVFPASGRAEAIVSAARSAVADLA